MLVYHIIINYLNFQIMAKLLQGIFGGVSGKIGNTIGSSWKGIPVIKTKPLSVANPRTASQVAQRSKFTYVTTLASLLLGTIVKPLWDRFAVKQSGYNSFVSSNVAVMDSLFPFDLTAIAMSKGKMEATEFTADNITSNESELKIEWVNDSGTGYKLDSDIAYAVVMDAANEKIYSVGGEVAREDEEITIPVDSQVLVNTGACVYLMFSRGDGTVVSNSKAVMFTSL